MFYKNGGRRAFGTVQGHPTPAVRHTQQRLVSTRTAAAAMPAVHGAGERLALFAGGALVLALVQLLQARRKGDAPANEDHGTRGRHTPRLRTFLEQFLGSSDRTSSIEVCVRVGQYPLVISQYAKSVHTQQRQCCGN